MSSSSEAKDLGEIDKHIPARSQLRLCSLLLRSSTPLRSAQDDARGRLSFALGRLALWESSRVAGEREAIVCTRYKKAFSGRKLASEARLKESACSLLFEADTLR